MEALYEITSSIVRVKNAKAISAHKDGRFTAIRQGKSPSFNKA
ncbi:MAG: hypothetical protein AB8G95_18450 [Anaerolineae bacterium]